jgi:hypothetical protein
MFNEDGVKHAGQQQQQQSKKHTQFNLILQRTNPAGRPNEVDERSPVQHTQH